MALMCCYVDLPGDNDIRYGHPAYFNVIHSNNPHITCPEGPSPFPLPTPGGLKPGRVK